MAESIQLPAGFEALQGFAETWALPTADQRLHNRMARSMEEIQRFYDAMMPCIQPALAHLDTFGLDNLPPSEQCLFQLVLASAEAGLAVEVYRAPNLPLAPSAGRFKVTHHHMGNA